MSVTAVDLKQCQDKLRAANDRIAVLEARPVGGVTKCTCPIASVRHDLKQARKRIAELEAVIAVAGVK